MNTSGTDERMDGGTVGRVEMAADQAAAGPLERLSALLDHATSPWRPHELPPLAHWLYFAPAERQSALDQDGHPKRGGFLPPAMPPRRMWVGSRVRFLRPIAIGAAMTRRSTLSQVSTKQGRSGAMVFVTVSHEVQVENTPAIIEEQDLVFRSLGGAANAEAQKGRAPTQVPESVRTYQPDTVKLFRFSALTFNAHRIHYDRDYARETEGYPGLVVQGPMLAMLLLDHYLSERPQSCVCEFSFRAERPLFDTSQAQLCFRQHEHTVFMWALIGTDEIAMSAQATLA